MKIKSILSVLLLTIMLYGCQTSSFDQKIEVCGVEDPVISLNGTWQFSMNVQENSNVGEVDLQKWADIQVPGECQMQGFAIKHDIPFFYKRTFFIPEDFRGKQILIDFYGVYSYAQVWVNGKFIREHFGGFTKWSCDITNHVTPGDSAMLTVEITDRTNDISYASGYAKHQIGGILRDVELIALPKQHFESLNFETDLDEEFKDARLKVFYALNRNSPAKIKIELSSGENKIISSVEKAIETPSGELVINVKNPAKWDAEHPNLYKVVATLYENGEKVLKQSKEIGFREVEVIGNKLLVNGMPVKLRGACRHDIHPLLGRMSTAEYDKRDVLLAKNANINFIRTSHYPSTERFLEYCDEYGIYVEDETAVCFVNSYRTEAYRATGASQNDPSFTGRYLSQLEEQMQNHRDHPSVIIWSIGNESAFGNNFLKSYNWIKEHDTTRPVIFSYPGYVPDSLKMYDIVSMHYPDWRGTLKQYGIETQDFSYKKAPMLFDEWAHVACYNNFELKEDPNVRNYWGQSLDSIWTKAFDADGCLGGAIWCLTDETFMLPKDLPGFNEWWGILDPDIIPASYMGPCVGYGEWGIIDTWRREKPEYWLTKKAFSPTKIEMKKINDFQPGKQLVIPVYNRFDHTDFNELTITWKYGDKSGKLENVYLGPHTKGTIIIPPNDWNPEQKLNICFFQNDTSLVDEYNIQLGERKIELTACKEGNLITEEKNDKITISGKNIAFSINKKTGLIEDYRVNDKILIKSGPYINLRFPGKRHQYSTIEMQDCAQNWKCKDFAFSIENGMASIVSGGVFDSISASFSIQFDENGIINIDYTINGLPNDKNVEEMGLKFIVGDSFEKLSWNRDPYFTAYPETHLGRANGEVELNQKPSFNYRQEPGHEWELDTKGFYYFGLDHELPYTNIVRSLKENIYSYSLTTERNLKIEVLSDGTRACRFNKIDGENTLIINEKWDYTSLLWGNYMKLIKLEEEYQGKIVLRAN